MIWLNDSPSGTVIEPPLIAPALEVTAIVEPPTMGFNLSSWTLIVKEIDPPFGMLNPLHGGLEHPTSVGVTRQFNPLQVYPGDGIDPRAVKGRLGDQDRLDPMSPGDPDQFLQAVPVIPQ